MAGVQPVVIEVRRGSACAAATCHPVEQVPSELEITRQLTPGEPRPVRTTSLEHAMTAGETM